VLHCFTGEAHHAKQALDLGFLLSFAGNLTYPSAAGLRAIAADVPEDRILVETDCPFLAPVPDRGKRNEPAFLARTAATLAALRGISPEALAHITSVNFSRFFHVADAVPSL
jgi:TatD DNase family protein